MKKIEVPPDHPRRESLEVRERVIEGHEKHIVATAGLLAHGRGEAFDYLIGEKTSEQARRAARAAVAAILSADNPVVSVNGNACALVANDLVSLSKATGAPLEINLFYYAREREDAVLKSLRRAGAERILGTHDRPSTTIPELSSNRRKVDTEGIARADVVLVPLEDGDRTEALRALGKFVIAIDLNPMSRTATHADITIVDNIVRVLPLMNGLAQEMKDQPREELKRMASEFDNRANLSESIRLIMAHLESEASRHISLHENTVEGLATS
ncbi:MAG: phosphopantothenate/pantothenate synthetase [Candidatus Thorarchaeota archaeon]|nr:MAG: phosphopantothenate/pantothenate synthetase [Candidatus Thorarchaeota archaeon]